MENLQFNKSLGYLLHNLSLNMKKRLEKEIKKFGLTSAHQFGVLMQLSKKNMSQKEISNVTLADEPSTTRMLDRMIKKDIIAKKRSEQDKRKQIVYITKKGETLLEQILPIVSQNTKYIEDLLDDNELELILKLLNKINSKI